MVDSFSTEFTLFLARFRPAGEAVALERALQRLADKSATDPDLYAALRDRPHAALASVGIIVPLRTRIVCHFPRAGRCDLVIPLEELSPNDWTPQVYAVLSRAVSDAVYAARLLSDPRTAIESLLGSRLPATVEVDVWRNCIEELHLVLPEECGQEPDRELSDAELEMVAGGTGPVIPWLVRGGRKGHSAR